MSKVSIVVPSYNEKDNVVNLVTQIDEALKGIDHEIIFVDDSTDDTPQVIEKVMETNPGVRLKHRDDEKGLATAVILGFKIAEGDYLAVMDADLQHPPAILRSMYAALETGVDFCIPSRFIPGGSDGGLNLYRKIVSGTARYIGKIFLPCLRKITDPTSGLFMFRREAIKDADMRPIGWKIMVEVLATATYNSVIEIPYCFQERTAGESKISTKVTLEYIKQVFELRRRGKKQKGMTVTKWSEAQVENALKELN